MNDLNKILSIFVIILFLTVIGLVWYIVELNTALNVYSESLNNTLTSSYFSKIKPESEKEINDIVNKVKNESVKSNKIQMIGQWTSDHVNNCFSRSDLCWNPSNGGNWKPLEITKTYYCDRIGGIRAKKGPFLNDLYWITYYKAGACGEQAVLFYEIANRSNLEVRIVHSDSGCSHEWNEVQIGNQWYYADISILKSMEKQSNNLSFWFNTTENYLVNSRKGNVCAEILKVTVLDTNEDISSNYSISIL